MSVLFNFQNLRISPILPNYWLLISFHLDQRRHFLLCYVLNFIEVICLEIAYDLFLRMFHVHLKIMYPLLMLGFQVEYSRDLLGLIAL